MAAMRTSLSRVAAVVSATVLSGGIVAALAPSASATPSLLVVSTSTYFDGTDQHVVGEVRNTGGGNVDLVTLHVSFFDAGNSPVGSGDSTTASLNRLAPGELSPFDDAFTPPPGYNHATVTATGSDTASPPNHNFTVVVTDDQTVDAFGYLHISGRLGNDNTTTADLPTMAFTYYDPSGKVVNQDLIPVSDSSIPAGGSSTFEELIPTTPAFARYAIVGQSDTAAAPNPSASPTATPSASPTASATASPTGSPTTSPTPTPSPTGTAADVTPTVALAPAVISAGQHVTVTYTGRPGATLDIYSKTQPATAYSRIASVVLDGSGHGTSTHAPTKNTRIMAQTSTGLASAQPLIQVRSVASINARRISTRSYTFSGRVYPAHTGRLVSLYRNGVLLAQGRTDASGIYTMTKTLAAGTFSFQVRTADDTYNLGTRSPARTWTIV
ncbi:MAG: hypothetical protein JWP11_2472 [Frankiales bacterium]|nr:hypothetical protein [Frankiales bacterium]